jgi:putative sterol carrier protein
VVGVEQFFATASLAVVRALPDGSAVAFDLSGEGGGTWTLRRLGDHIEIEREAKPPIDTRLTCSVEDFNELVGGRLDATRAFLQGRLRVEGDVGLILELHAALR